MEVARVQPTNSANRELLLEELLVSLCELAIKEGAHECAVIECKDPVFKETSGDTSDVPIDERSIFWPVPRFPNDSIHDALRQYSRAVVFRLNLNDETQPATSPDHDDFPANSYSLDAAKEQVFKIAGLVESACFYRGCHLSIGLAAGNCKDVFCKFEQRCHAFTTGKPCLHPLKSRPSIEACGLDPEMIAAKAGWRDTNQKAFIVGMVFVG